jgi:hypothetical protein
MPEKIQTLHPDPAKTGRNIAIEKYDLIKSTMLKVLKNGPLTHTGLMDAMNAGLAGKFDGNIGWYSETVKLDLEARKIIGRTSDKPQKYCVIQAKG